MVYEIENQNDCSGQVLTSREGRTGDERESVEEINEKFRGSIAWVEASSKGWAVFYDDGPAEDG